LPYRSLGKSVHLNCPNRGQISGFGLPLTAVTKNLIKKKTSVQWTAIGWLGRHVLNLSPEPRP